MFNGVVLKGPNVDAENPVAIHIQWTRGLHHFLLSGIKAILFVGAAFQFDFPVILVGGSLLGGFDPDVGMVAGISQVKTGCTLETRGNLNESPERGQKGVVVFGKKTGARYADLMLEDARFGVNAVLRLEGLPGKAEPGEYITDANRLRFEGDRYDGFFAVMVQVEAIRKIPGI
jgi:hypothetical protein